MTDESDDEPVRTVEPGTKSPNGLQEIVVSHPAAMGSTEALNDDSEEGLSFV